MSINQRIHLVLRHDNVLGRNETLVHSSITQIDLHDFSRLTLTYDLGGFHAVSAMEAQHRISGEVLFRSAGVQLEVRYRNQAPSRVVARGGDDSITRFTKCGYNCAAIALRSSAVSPFGPSSFTLTR